MIAVLAVAHVVIAVVLILLSALTIWSFPLFLIGPVWAILLARRMWRRDPTVVRSLRRTHAVFLGIDALMIAYGFWMLKAAEESAKRGGGLLGGLGIIPIVIGGVLAAFSIITLIVTCTVNLFPQKQ
jgi:hypothetical protein